MKPQGRNPPPQDRLSKRPRDHRSDVSKSEERLATNSYIMNNLELLDFSIAHPEPYVEDAYAKDKLIITGDPTKQNGLMTANALLIERI